VPGLNRAKPGMYLAILFYCLGKKICILFMPVFNRLLKFLPGHFVGKTAAVTGNHMRCLHCVIWSSKRHLAVSVAHHVVNKWSVNKINNISDSSTVSTVLPVYICTRQVLGDLRLLRTIIKIAGKIELWKVCHGKTGQSRSFSTFAGLENSCPGKTNWAE